MDNLLQVVSKVKDKMSNYIISELKNAGHKDLYISHGAILMNFKDKKEMNYKELSKRINKSQQTMTTLIRKLEKEGYITLQVDQKDKRNKLVQLSKKGEEFIPLMFRISENMFNIQYSGFTDTEKQTLKPLLSKLLLNFEENNNDN